MVANHGLTIALSTNGVFGSAVRKRLEGLHFASVSVSLDGMRAANVRCAARAPSMRRFAPSGF